MLYLKVKQFSGKEFLRSEDDAVMGSWKGIIETVNASSPFTSILIYLFTLCLHFFVKVFENSCQGLFLSNKGLVFLVNIMQHVV